MKDQGIVVVLTGEGKGKTTSALGIGLRAVGRGMRVLMVQFIKGELESGEWLSIKRLYPDFELHSMGRGFVGIMGDRKPRDIHREEAQRALDFALERMKSGNYDVIILDEINVAVSLGLIPVEKILNFIDEKPYNIHLIMTGRGAYPEILERADLVTEMIEVKHPFKEGKGALRGIDY